MNGRNQVIEMIGWHRNSWLASAISLLGWIAVLIGIKFVVDDKAVGFLVIAAGLIGPLLGKYISTNKHFSAWWEQVEHANLTDRIRTDAERAYTLYQQYPDRRTLKKIEQINPAAADLIRERLQNEKGN